MHKRKEREKKKGKCTHWTVFRTKPTTTAQKYQIDVKKKPGVLSIFSGS
jgi:hypothetical protein